MTHSNGSQLPRRLCRRLTATAVVLLAALGSSRVCVADSAISGADAALRFGGQVNALVIDPHIPTTLYAASECFGVLESVDGGESWHVASTGLPGLVKKLAVDPTATPTTLYAAAGSGTTAAC